MLEYYNKISGIFLASCKNGSIISTARSVGTHTMSAAKWALYENALLQSELFAEPKPTEQVQEKTKADSGSGFAATRRRKGGNFVTNY